MKKVSFRPAPLPRLDRIATRCPAPPAHAPLHSASPSRLAPAPALRSALFVTSPHRPGARLCVDCDGGERVAAAVMGGGGGVVVVMMTLFFRHAAVLCVPPPGAG